MSSVVKKLLDRIETNSFVYEMLSILVGVGILILGMTLMVCTSNIIVGLVLTIGGGLLLGSLNDFFEKVECREW